MSCVRQCWTNPIPPLTADGIFGNRTNKGLVELNPRLAGQRHPQLGALSIVLPQPLHTIVKLDHIEKKNCKRFGRHVQRICSRNQL